jgi:hypothetical protein
MQPLLAGDLKAARGAFIQSFIHPQIQALEKN